jgi:hypothetical protein
MCEVEETMKLYKQLRRERALARFSIQDFDTYCAERALPRTDGAKAHYADYVARKEVERKALNG